MAALRMFNFVFQFFNQQVATMHLRFQAAVSRRCQFYPLLMHRLAENAIIHNLSAHRWKNKEKPHKVQMLSGGAGVFSRGKDNVA